MASFTIYPDGSGTTGGPAGIGFIALADGLPFSHASIPVADATNHQAELRAATYALDSLPEGLDVVLISDSEYVVKGFAEYMPNWRARGWPERNSGPVRNRPLWLGLIAAVERHRSVRFEWTPAHAGTDGNEQAHRLASKARQAALLAFGSSPS
jgi:ribonuclease HI